MIAVGALTYLVGYSNKTDDAIRTANETRTQVAKDLADIKNTLDLGLRDLRLQIAALPDVSARLAAVERRLDSIERMEGSRDIRIGNLEARAVQNRADIDNLQRSVVARDRDRERSGGP